METVKQSPKSTLLAIVILTITFSFVLNTDLRNYVRAKIHSQERTILAVAHADLDQSGDLHQILKVKSHQGIFVEIYKDQKLVAQAQVPDNRDVYFTFAGQVTNLAIDDVNNDQKPEIIASSIDRDNVGHLNVYQLDPEKKELALVKMDQ